MILGVIGGGFFYVVKKRIIQEAKPSVVSINKTIIRKMDKKISFSDDVKLKIKISSGEEISAEVAQSDAKKHIGLGGKKEFFGLIADSMLFVFDSSSNYSFWNKDMFFPIDIIWIKDDTVIDITENMPDFKTSPNYTVTPKGAVNFVLEVNAGFIKENSVKIGDKVEFK